MEFNNKNDYSITVFKGSGVLVKLAYVHNLYKASKWLDDKFPNWEYFNVYNRRSRVYMGRINKSDSFIEPKPKTIWK